MLTFKILGPLEVVRDGEVLPLGPAKQRAFVACLLLHPGETVSIDRLTDELWGQDPPSRAPNNLQQYVFRLRKILDDHGRLVLITRSPGYRLELGEHDLVDATLFERCVRQAREVIEGRPAEALQLLERGLAMWRGPALADFTYQGFAEASARRLEDLRAAAEEARIEALLALGRENDAIPEVESLVQRFPLREHVRALQMLALYRAGRQSEALNAYQDARKALAAELGIDPGHELRSLEQAILQQDPNLQLPTAAAPIEISSITVSPSADERAGDAPPDEAVRGPRRPRRRPGLLVGGAVVVVALVTLIAVIASRDESGPPPSPSGATGEPASDELRLAWQEASSEDFLQSGDQRILGGVRTETGFLVFGYTTDEPETVGGKRDLDTAVWVGDPEQQWDPVTSDEFGGEGNQRATDVVIFGTHATVLVGSSALGGGFDAAAWVQSSGSDAWEKADVKQEGLHEGKDQSIRDAVQVRSQLIAVGSTGSQRDADAALWWSSRGQTWTSLHGAVDSEEGAEEMTGIAMSAEGVLVAGGFIDDGAGRDAAVWIGRMPQSMKRIRAGETVDALGGLGDQQINSIIAGGPGFVAVGEETTLGGDTNAVVWTSVDGRRWSRVTDTLGAFGGEGEQRMYAVTTSDVGLVAAGSDRLPAEDGFERWDAAVWTSIDGEDWIRLPGDDPSMSALADVGNQEIKALIPVDESFLALGAEAESGSDWDARVWIGRPAP